MDSGGQKRPFGATIRTLNDITNSSTDSANLSNNKPPLSAAANAGNNDGSESNKVGISATTSNIKMQHITNLPRSSDASSILQRIHSEFSQIIQKRQYNVRSITEMCCCSDGLDHLPNRRGRKTKIMPNNVLGYNLTHFTRPKTHAIHLRLRHPKTHELLDYESIAGTMCHELAHCVVGPHNAQFYKVMGEIEEQYALFLVRGLVLDKQGFPVGSDNAHRLGGRKISPEEARRRAMQAAEKRRGLSSGQYVLGGKSNNISDPREAARIAAERRLRDSQFCLPCNEVIELLGDDSDDEDAKGMPFDGDKKKRAKPSNKSESSEVIDLTEDETLEFLGTHAVLQGPSQIQWECACCTLINQSTSQVCEACETPPIVPAVASAPTIGSRLNDSPPKVAHAMPKSTGGKYNEETWSCLRCTFDNSHTALVCGACCLER